MKRILTILIASCAILTHCPDHAEGGGLKKKQTKALSIPKKGVTPAPSPSYSPDVSRNGRYVVFASLQGQLTSPSFSGNGQVVWMDRKTGKRKHVSRASFSQTPANAQCFEPRVSDNGRYIIFRSAASNLSGILDPAGHQDIFRHDRVLGATELVTVTHDGNVANGPSASADLSANGRYVVFASQATNLTTAAGNGLWQVHLRDMKTATTSVISLSSNQLFGNGDSLFCAISDNGRFIAIQSKATNIGSGGNAAGQIWVHDRADGGMELISRTTTGVGADSSSQSPAISANGRFVAFSSGASNLLSGDVTPAMADIFVFDRKKETMKQIVAQTGQGPKYASTPSISSNGRYLSCTAHDGNANEGQVYLLDRKQNKATMFARNSRQKMANDYSNRARISGNGKFVVFDSHASNLGKDRDAVEDIFIRRR